MTFQLVYYSQQDPRWKQDILGDNTDPKYNIGYVGCALTSVAMLLSGHGYTETPKTLNQKLQNIGGFSDGAIRWNVVSQLYSQVVVRSSIPCFKTDAPLNLIDASIAAGQPAIVMVDSVSGAGFNTHWVVLYAKEGNDYLMLDPWPYQPDVTKKTYLMPRYSDGNPLQRTIMHVILYECYTASGGIALPGGGSVPSTTTTTHTTTTTEPATSGISARVKADVTAGLNIRSSIDTSSMANIVASVPAGAVLTIVEADGEAKIGAFNQWVRVNDGNGHEGFCAAWFLEKVQGSTTTTPSTTTTTNTTTSSTTSTAATTTTPSAGQLTVMVGATVGRFGLNVYQSASTSSTVVSNEKARAKLVVSEDAAGAMKKIGVQGQWIKVQASNGKQGFVEAAKVKKP